MENSDVFVNVKQGVAGFAESMRSFFHTNPYVYAFLLIVVFIYGSQYVPSLPKQLTPILNNPIAHFLYFYLVCALISPELSMQGAIVAILVTLVINFISSNRKAPADVLDAPEEAPEEELARARMLGYEGEEEEEGEAEAEAEAEEEFNRRAVEEEYRRQAAAAAAQQGPVEEAPVAHENGGYAPAFN